MLITAMQTVKPATQKTVKMEHSHLLHGAISRLLILILLVTAASSAAPSAAPSFAPSLNTECAAELEAFSACLPAVSVSKPPNNFTAAAVSEKCCDAITFPLNSTRSGDYCICNLLQQPQVFGFNLSLSRVLLLPSVCLGKTMRLLELLKTCSSVEFSAKFVSDFGEDIRKCDIVIKGGCADEECCRHLCEKRLPYAKSMDVRYNVINGVHLCYCHATYQDKPDSCAIILNFWLN